MGSIIKLICHVGDKLINVREDMKSFVVRNATGARKGCHGSWIKTILKMILTPCVLQSSGTNKIEDYGL
jgi:hypothetical protein